MVQDVGAVSSPKWEVAIPTSGKLRIFGGLAALEPCLYCLVHFPQIVAKYSVLLVLLVLLISQKLFTMTISTTADHVDRLARKVQGMKHVHFHTSLLIFQASSSANQRAREFSSPFLGSLARVKRP